MAEFSRKRILVAEFHTQMKAQLVSGRKHVAFTCVICGTVQSMASMMKADPSVTEDRAEKYIGFSCEGRLSNVGPWPAKSDKTKKAVARRKMRGCNWTLGGLFQLHTLEVVTEDGSIHPTFELATPEEAQALEKEMTA